MEMTLTCLDGGRKTVRIVVHRVVLVWEGSFHGGASVEMTQSEGGNDENKRDDYEGLRLCENTYSLRGHHEYY